jgi:MFS family permease
MTLLTAPARTDLGLVLSLPVVVAALGYFVDIYDLLLFGIVRVPSLRDLGLSEAQISTVGARIQNWQMAGLLLGGILWGTLGDKRGRLSVLFGSIITYSLANIASGFVKQVTFMSPTDYYAAVRFVAGIGLAGELGAGITLVSELLPTRLRAIGASLITFVGILGAVVAYFTVRLFDWQTAYFMGGGMGLGLLLLRVSVVESGMFRQVASQKHVRRGDFLLFFTNRDRLRRYLKCIGIALPNWFASGVLATFGNEFGQALSIPEPIQPGLVIMWGYLGTAVGGLASGVLSQVLQSRIRAVVLMMSFAALMIAVFLFGGVKTAGLLYAVSGIMGIGTGYWAMFVTIGAEQFGTNLRATAATTIPNMVRGMVIPMTGSYIALKPTLGIIGAGATVGAVCFALAFYCILTVPETHGKDLDFVEE